MWYEADLDAAMARTARRPIPRGRVSRTEALAFGLGLAACSVAILALINLVAAVLLAFTIFFYVVVYTMWLKRRTPQNIVIGGVAGVLPPVIGWVAAAPAILHYPAVDAAALLGSLPRAGRRICPCRHSDAAGRRRKNKNQEAYPGLFPCAGGGFPTALAAALHGRPLWCRGEYLRRNAALPCDPALRLPPRYGAYFRTPALRVFDFVLVLAILRPCWPTKRCRSDERPTQRMPLGEARQ